LQRVTDASLDNAAFPFATCRQIEMGYARVMAMRVSYVGELGWELYVPSEYAGPVFDELMSAGRDLDITLAGYHALDSLRSEKGYRSWGHDITPAETPLEAGLALGVENVDEHASCVQIDAGVECVRLVVEAHGYSLRRMSRAEPASWLRSPILR
jgi:glycine cleavage system aminomethyltransferase T